MILAVAINKGGVGKSTTCGNLAAVAYERGQRVLIVDADNQGNAALSFGINPDDFDLTIYDALTEQAHPDECIYRLYGEEPDGPCIDLMPAGDEMAVFEIDVLIDQENFDYRFEHMRRMLTRVSSDYDAILIDTPPNIGVTVGNVLTAADGVLVPFHPERYSMRSLTKILQAIQDFRTVQNSRLKFVGTFPVLVDSRTILHTDTIAEVEKYSREAGFTMFQTMIPRSIRVSASVSYKGQPLVMASPDDPLADLYRRLWDEVLENQQTREEERKA